MTNLNSATCSVDGGSLFILNFQFLMFAFHETRVAKPVRDFEFDVFYFKH